MTLVGLEFLKQQETRRANKASENLKLFDVQSRVQTASADRTSRERVANLDRESRETVAAQDRSSREHIANFDRASKETIARADRESRENIASADRSSKERVATDDRISKESIAAADRTSRENIASDDRIAARNTATADRIGRAEVARINNQAQVALQDYKYQKEEEMLNTKLRTQQFEKAKDRELQRETNRLNFDIAHMNASTKWGTEGMKTLGRIFG